MSKLPFELLLALRYLRPKRTFVSIITFISITGVALGVAVLIIVISVMSGFDHDLREKILGFNSHLTVLQDGSPMTNYDAVADIVAKNPNVRGVAPFIAMPVLVETSGASNLPAMQDTPFVRGVDPEREGNVTQLPKKIVFGNFDLSGHGMVVGMEFARNLNLSIGDHLSIYSTHEAQKIRAILESTNRDEALPLPEDFEIRGIFDMGYNDFDAHIVCVSLDNAQELADFDDAVHGLLVMLHDPDQAAVVKREIEKTLGPNYYCVTWMEQNSIILNQLVVEKSMMFYIIFFIVIVASFGITCTLITFVILKTREIGIMKAIGATNFQIMLVFVIQSLIVSVAGVASGLALGLYAIHVRNGFLHLMSHLFGFNLFPPSIYGFYDLPAIVSMTDLVIICGGSLIICLCAAILPAHYASKLKPVEALRYE